MDTWVRDIPSKLIDLLIDENGATATEYAVIVSALVLAVIATIYFLANREGTGILQTIYSFIAALIGQFGKVG